MTDKPLPFNERVHTTRMGHDALHEVYPGMEVCDFCLSTNVAGHYDVTDEVRVDTPRTTHVSDDGWNACPECHEVIDADSLHDLVARAVTGITNNVIASQGGSIDAMVLVESLSRFMSVRGEWHPL